MRFVTFVALLSMWGVLSGGRGATALANAFDFDVHGPRFVVAGSEVTFAAVTGSDDASDDLAYSWDFGDGTTGNGQTVTHTYATAGSYVLRVAAASQTEPDLVDGEGQIITVGDSDPLTPGEGATYPLRDPYGAGPFGAVEVSRDARGDWAVFSRLEGARNIEHSYVVSLCRAEPDGAVQCTPTGSALGLRFCQTQPVNTGIVYCGHVDELGNWSGTDLLQRFVYPDLGYEPNLVLISYLQDGSDFYRADLDGSVPAQLQLSPMPAVPDDD